jgi:Fur family ferric uptake transcriptional regulator
MATETRDQITDSLRAAGFRLTRPRMAVINVFAVAQGMHRPEQVHALAQRECPSLGLVTVYRTLALLEQLGHLNRVHFENGCSAFARTDLAHGHHLVCRLCHQVVEFPGDESVMDMLALIARQTGFLIEDHMLELFGVCPECQGLRDT